MKEINSIKFVQADDESLSNILNSLKDLASEQGTLDGIILSELETPLTGKTKGMKRISSVMNIFVLSEKYQEKLNGTLDRFLEEKEI